MTKDNALMSERDRTFFLGGWRKFSFVPPIHLMLPFGLSVSQVDFNLNIKTALSPANKWTS